MSEAQAESAFEAIRFAKTGGEPHCVWCNCEVAYRINRKVKDKKTGEVRCRRLFKCKKCLKQFSVTSGTAFHSRKLGFKKIMLGVLLFANGVNGKAALQIRRDLKINPKSAWHLGKRLREPLTSYQVGRPLNGEVQMDATEIGGSVRKANEASDRKTQPRRDMSKVTKLSVLRERGRFGRVVPHLGDEGAVVDSILTLLDLEAQPIVDESPRWNGLDAIFNNVRRIKHKERYSDMQGTSTNLAESYFSRFKRMYRGVYFGFSSQYAHLYNGEGTWREEHRHYSNGEQFVLCLATALHHPPTSFRGYYQRTRRKEAA